MASFAAPNRPPKRQLPSAQERAYLAMLRQSRALPEVNNNIFFDEQTSSNDQDNTFPEELDPFLIPVDNRYIGANRPFPSQLAQSTARNQQTESDQIFANPPAAEDFPRMQQQARVAAQHQKDNENDDQSKNTDPVSRVKERSNASIEAQQKAADLIKDKGKRFFAKALGNGSNAVGSFGFDGWITFGISFLYMMVRGVVTVLMPESGSSSSSGSQKDVQQMAIHTIFPPYRPLQEPVDFLYFLLMLILSCVVVTLLITFFILAAGLIAGLT